MRVLVIGSGGREHAICRSFSESKGIEKIFCASGNAGIAEVAECIAIAGDDIGGLADFARENDIGITFVGPEVPLALGIVDIFEKRGLAVIGPGAAAARLESSKAFAKDFMARHEIPTAVYRVAGSPDEASAILNSGAFGKAGSPVVVKADGLAAGKGVVVAENRAEALSAISELASIAGPEAASKIVLEECLAGREISLLAFVAGDDFALMPPTRDHKRIGEGDTGPNTGGMGTISDDALLSAELTAEIVESIVKPTLRGCKEEGFSFCGILFLGLMMTADGPKVLEYNVRFGDPETQSILVRLETDLLKICAAMVAGKLAETELKWKPGSSATVVLAARGYPQNPQKGDVVSGLEEVEDAVIFHSGTKRNGVGEFVTAGGRVLGVTATGDNLADALGKCYAEIGKISWDGMQYRRDIGK